MTRLTGSLLAIFTFFAWGVLPVYWKQLDHIDSVAIVLHRIIWSCFFLVLLSLGTRRFDGLRKLFQNKKAFLYSVVSGLLIAFNWGIYIYAVNTDRVIDASLGYYINPLVSVLLGVIFLREKLSKVQVLACLFALSGVLVLAVRLGSFPWIALLLAGTFGFYGLCKKNLPIKDSITTLTAENLILFIPACVLLAWFGGAESFSNEALLSRTNLFLVGTGIVTAIPLMTFTAAAQRIRLSSIGFFQYIGPTGNLLLGVLLYGETFTSTHALSFGMVWLGLVFYSYGSFQMIREEKHLNYKIRKQTC